MNIFEVLIIQPIFNLLISIYSIIPGADFGVAVIIFTVLVRFALYPLTRSMLHQSRAMRKLQPQLAKIKKDAKGNRQIESAQMMELYKKNGVNPLRSIGILAIQLPIFIALYNVIRIFTEHRDEIGKFTYDFLENVPAISHLIANPSSFNENFLGVISLTKPAISGGTIDFLLVLVALAAAAAQFVMSKQTMPTTKPRKRLRDIMAEAAEGKQANQSEMNAVVTANMTKILPFFMFVVMISVPGALALYYAVSNLVAVGQQAYLLKQDEEELEEIAEEPSPNAAMGKSTKQKPVSAKTRAKRATQANVTRIVAKDSRKSRRKK